MLLGSCALFDFEQTPQITEAQLEEMQSRQWEASIEDIHKNAVFVLRGLGYRISSDTALTFIEATGLTQQLQAADDCRNEWNPSLKIFVKNCQRGERYQVFRRYTLTMERIGQYTHLRLIAVDINTRSGDRIVADSALYEQVFGKIEERLFVRSTLE